MICPTGIQLSKPQTEQLYFRYYFILFTLFLGPHLWHMEVPRLGIKSELPLPATTATATLDPRQICNLHISLGQCWILNPLSRARDLTCILMDTSQILNPTSRNGNSLVIILEIRIPCPERASDSPKVCCGHPS